MSVEQPMKAHRKLHLFTSQHALRVTIDIATIDLSFDVIVVNRKENCEILVIVSAMTLSVVNDTNSNTTGKQRQNS